jgi:response regulator RpfG family c-di-GMP phosphodiesterase
MPDNEPQSPTTENQLDQQMLAIERKLKELWSREADLGEREKRIVEREERFSNSESRKSEQQALLQKSRYVESQLRTQIADLQKSNQQLQTNLEEVVDSLTFKIGVELRESLLHPGMRTLKMPFRILGMLRKGK